jgi:dipeptidase
MPNYVGGLMWGGLAEAACSGHIPWYCGITRTPESYTIGTMKERTDDAIAPFKGSIYDEKSAYWNFRIISILVNLFYTATKDEVIPVWRAWEDELYRLQPFIEKTALSLHKNDPELAKEFLTNYSNSKAEEALELTKNMITRLYTIMAHYNGSI